VREQALQESSGGGDLILAGALGLDVEEQDPLAVEQERQDVTMVVLYAFLLADVQDPLRAVWAVSQEAAGRFVAIEDEWPDSLHRRLEGLLASSARIVVAQERADVADDGECGDTRHRIGTGHGAAHPAPPGFARTMLFKCVETSETGEEHEEDALEHLLRRDLGTHSGVPDHGDPLAQTIHAVDISKQTMENESLLPVCAMSAG